MSVPIEIFFKKHTNAENNVIILENVNCYLSEQINSIFSYKIGNIIFTFDTYCDDLDGYKLMHLHMTVSGSICTVPIKYKKTHNLRNILDYTFIFDGDVLNDFIKDNNSEYILVVESNIFEVEFINHKSYFDKCFALFCHRVK